ncbi:spore coat protein U domain-containing protein [Niveispirillum fermenti]|uniref:spore coat protein U domain-containing protein n=1 Tax=Niveispirillum fermenti TaxID=1233113 RepID=UPI003A8C1D8A
MPPMFQRLPFLPVLLLLAGTLPAMAKDSDRCDIDIRSIDRIEPTAEYDPYGGGATGYNEIELRHKDGGACALLVGIDDGGNGTRVMESAKDRLVYELYKDARLSQRVGDIRGNESAMFPLAMSAKQDTARLQVFSYIEPGQLVAKGTYQDRVTVNVYELRDGTPYGPIASRTAQVRTKVRSVVSASVVVDGVSRPLSGSVGTLDMGELTRGGSGRFELSVSGNGDYSLSLSSENAGRLVSRDSPSGIGYRLYVGGRAVSLGSGTTVGLGGAGNYELRVESDAAPQALAGTYHDNLILTITTE